jgi:hypothetical protein
MNCICRGSWILLTWFCLPLGTQAAPPPETLGSEKSPAVSGQAPIGTEPLLIAVSNRVQHQMLSGVGASWHSLLHPTVSHGGSAFGGSPPVVPQHEGLWTSMEKHAEWLGLKFIRAEMDWRQWQPEKGRLTWDSPEFRVLDRILSWAQRHGSDVMLQCMWPNVEWLAFPEYRHDPALVQTSAPADLAAFADGWVTLLRELRERRGYTCIRWINLVNEPNYYWWLIPPDTGAQQDRARQVRYLAEALQTVRAALQEADLPVKLMGPDFTDLPIFEKLSTEPWFVAVDDVDFHSYCSCFDWEEPQTLPASWAYRMGERLSQTLVKYRAETAAAGKGLFLTEAGTQTYGFKADDPAPGSFRASLKDTQLLIRALALGIDGFNHWSFVNRGDQDGQWQFVDTWDRQWKQWQTEADPHRDAYYVLGLATRHMPMRAKILDTQVRGGMLQNIQRVWVAAVRSPTDDSLTLLIVNDADQPWLARFTGEALPRSLFALTSVPDGDPNKTLVYQTVEASGTPELPLAPFSLTIVTDRPLAADGPGRF